MKKIVNISVVIMFLGLFTYIPVKAQMSGTYTVGSGGTYTSLTAAYNALVSNGINGPVTFSINNGVYNESISMIGAIPGASTINVVTFTSTSGNASNVTIGDSLSSATTVLSLADVSHMIFKNITIGLNSINAGIAIEMSGMCENVLFYGCNIQTYQDGTVNSYCGIKYYNSNGSTKYLKDVRFIKNNVDGGYYNFWFNYAAGSTANMASSAMSVTIDSNVMTNAYYAGIYSYYYSSYQSISYNIITSRNSDSVTSNWYGIHLYDYHNVEKIIGNKIRSSNTSVSSPCGIYIYSSFNCSDYSGSGAGLIANNEIILYTTSSCYGIYLYSLNSNVQLLYNSVYMHGTGNADGLYTYNRNLKYKPVIKNNNFVTFAGSSAYPIYYNGPFYNTSYFTVDYNNYYSSGAYVGYAGSARNTLISLQSATLQDLGSTSRNPGYGTNPTNLIPANWFRCPIMAEVPKDIVGNLRLGLTYKGCYNAAFEIDVALTEFVALGDRSSAGTNSIKVRLINLGKTTLTNVSVLCSVNGVMQTPVNLTGLLLSQYQDTIITVGSFLVTIGVTSNLKAWTYNPNDSADKNLDNDTITLSTVGCALVLNGTYDIGGGNNDFITVDAAIIALSNCGVSGPVVLRLANGTYNTLTSFSTIYYGTTVKNTITFTSLSGNASDVVIGTASGTALTFNGAKHLRFDKVTIGNTNGNTTYGVYFQNTNENIEFYGCNIYSYTSASATATNYACVYYPNTNGSTHTLKNVRFIKNNINGGYYNFYMNFSGSSTADMSKMSVIIDSNIIQNAYYYAIYSNYYGYFPSISYNTITARTSGFVSSYWYGLFMNYYNSVEKIEGNTIKSTNSSISHPYGIFISYYFNYNGYGTSNNRPLVKNNEIILNTSNTVYGIYMLYPYSNMQILHNSIYTYGGSDGSGIYAYHLSTTENHKPSIIGNISMVSGRTHPIYYGAYFGSSYYEAVDYNNYYSTGTYVGYTDNILTSLLALQNSTGQDANSISQNPGFILPTTSLHTPGKSMLIDPISNILYDKQGLARVSITNMGCYHDFVPEDNDVKMAEIVSPSSGILVGVANPITVKIMNFGGNRLDSVKINWSVNGGTLNTINYYCNLAFGTTSSNITLELFIPISGLNTLVVYTTNPNGVADENTGNDTIAHVVYACDSMLNGIYTVGSGGNFATMNIALMALQNCGVSGAVELKIATGTYPGLTIDAAFPGTSSTKMVTFTSTSGNAADVIFDAANTSALTLNGAKDLKFKQITFGNTINTLTGVSFSNTNTNIEFYECNIYASLSNIVNTCAAVYCDNSSDSTHTLKNVRFIKNNINGGYSNFWFNYPAGSITNMSQMSVVIDSNNITGAYMYAIYAYYYGYYPSISYNTITSRTAGSINSQWTGLYLCYYNSVEKIEGNRIISTNVNITYPYGIYIYYYFNYNGYGTSNNSPLIANNEIILYTTGSYSGIYLYYPYSNVQFLNNSIYMYGTGSPYALHTSSGSTACQIVIKNNIFATVAATTSYPIYYNNNYSTSYYTVDYNNYYSTGVYIAYAGNAIPTLSGLQSATGQDANSISQNPNFLAPTSSLNTDGYKMFVTPLMNIKYDIDGKSRGLVTNMGCYHNFNPYNDDAKMATLISPSGGITVGQPTPLTINLMNMGSSVLDSVRIHWSVNNGPINSVDYYCDLAFSATSPAITLDTFIPVGGTNNFLVYSTLPNGIADEFPTNDTIQTTAFACDSILRGIYTVGKGGDLSDVKEVITALYECGINGPVEFRFMAGSYGNLSFSKNIPGTSTLNTVTITSLSGNAKSVTFASSRDVTLILNNVSNVIFKNITINSILGTHAVEFKNKCSNILLYECNIMADPATTMPYAGIYRSGSSGSANTLSNIRIIKNNISGGYYNIYWYYGGDGSISMGRDCLIDSNVCTNAYYYGIYLYYSYTNFNSVSYNTVTCRSVNNSSYFHGINFSFYNNVREVTGNKVHIRNLAVNNAYPMYIYYNNNYYSNPFGPMLIENNEIITEVGFSSYGGIYVSMSTPAYIINNSIYVSALTTAYGLYLMTNSTTYPIVAKNNNVHVANAGYPLYIPSPTYATLPYTTRDYNNYYNVADVAYVGDPYPTLTDLRAAIGQDVNSVSILPLYLNLSNNLELIDYSGFLCARSPNVLYDITREARSTITSMGAYSSYIFEGYDMAITSIIEPFNTEDVMCYQDYASIKVVVANKGSLPINFATTSMILRVDVQGVVNFHADTIISVGSLTATKKDTIEITNLLPASLSGVYNITAWLELGIDKVSVDDTIESVYIIDKIRLPYNINFDTMPNGLIFKQLVGTSGWTVESGDGVNPFISPFHGTGRLQFLSETESGSMAKATLQPFSLQGSVLPQMKFWYAHDNANPMARDYTEVKISIDGGVTYSTLLYLQRYNAAYSTPTFVRYEIDLTPYTAYSCVILAFEAGSYGGGNQNIDSIAITSNQDISITLEVLEQSDFVACELENKDIKLKMNNMTAQVFNFENNPSQINLKVSGAVDTLFTIPLISGTIQGDTALIYDVTNTFDFSTNGTYNLMAYLSSADDNTLNDTARLTRIIHVDAELIKIDSIVAKDVGDLAFPTIYITNNGNMPINGIPLIITINNVKVIWETIDTLLNPGYSITYTFNQPFSVPTASEQQPYYQIKIEVDLECDGVKANNSLLKYYNVNIEGPIDLLITEIFHPEADSCNLGFTKIYPSIEVYNSGTGYAQGAVLYVLVDSLGITIQSFSEILDDVAGRSAITFNCSNYYTVPNFTGTYTAIFNIVFLKDVNTANNSKSVITCAEDALSIVSIDGNTCVLGQNIPNPATTSTVIPYSIPKEGKVSFKVMSINGQILYKEEKQASTGTHYLELNTSILSNGIYYYSMEYQGQRIVKKMTVQR